MIETGYSGNSEYSTNANLPINSGAALQKHILSALENGCLSKRCIYTPSERGRWEPLAAVLVTLAGNSESKRTFTTYSLLL
jgi:hypothetical protein